MKYWHMSGAGNDFIVMDARGLRPDFSALAVQLCAHTGADGFLAVDHSQKEDFKLHFYNPDGLRGEMCGNGCRCVCRFAYDRGIAGENMTVETDAGPVFGKRLGESQYLVRLNNPGVLDLNRKPGVSYVELGDPGIPHALVELPRLNWEDAEALRETGRALCHDAAFPKGANVSFYARIGENRIRVLTYERGVEDYTLACGTGCGSVAAVLWRKGQLPGGQLLAENRGGILKLTVEGENGHLRSLYLEGPAVYVREYDI